MPQLNTYSDISSLANPIQEDVIFLEHNINVMASLVTVFNGSGGNPRKIYQYNSNSAQTVAEVDDLTSQAFTPSLLATLTPAEIGLQYFITDLRADTDSFESIRTEAAQELGFAAVEKVESDLLGLFDDFTGGTIGSSGTTLTWGHVSAAIAQCRVANKSNKIPLYVVLHEYQWQDLAKAASIAASTSLSQAPQFTEGVTAEWYRGRFGGADLFVSPNSAMLSSTDAYGAVFPRKAIGLDWRRPIRVSPERDESRRGLELNMSAVYAKGLIKAALGVQILSDATAPTS